MVKAVATATEIQNHFGKYLDMVMGGDEVIITKNGKEVGRIVPRDPVYTYLTDTLTGILPEGVDMEQTREEMLRKKYEMTD